MSWRYQRAEEPDDMMLVDNWKKVVIANFANFSTRASRAEFWYFYLANLIVYLVTGTLGRASSVFFVVGFIYSLAVLIPTLAVATRRLHDVGKSGLWLFISFVPIVGLILLIVWWAQEGHDGDNIYGMSPKNMIG